MRDNPTTAFPSTMEIDYIRVYQKINSSASINICSAQDIIGSTVAGQEIIVGGANCSVVISDGEFLDLTAVESIEINANFSVEIGSQFSAKTLGL